jgi:hypothetical protein
MSKARDLFNITTYNELYVKCYTNNLPFVSLAAICGLRIIQVDYGLINCMAFFFSLELF